MNQLDIRSRTKNQTTTPIVVRHPTPSKKLRLLMTPTPQPCLKQTEKRSYFSVVCWWIRHASTKMMVKSLAKQKFQNC